MSDDANPDLKLICSIIDSSAPLREKVKDFMWKLDATIDQFDSIRNVFNLATAIESSILFYVKQKELLQKLLTNGNKYRSVDFYLKWFSAFMTSDKNKKMIIENDEFAALLNAWTKCFVHESDVIVKIIKEIDSLISTVQNNSCSTYFIEHMVNLCFQQSKALRISLYDPNGFIFV